MKVSKKLKQIYLKTFLSPVVYNADKYSDHNEAFINNDFQLIHVDSYPDFYSEIFDLYDRLNSTVKSINLLDENNFAFAVPACHLNTYQEEIFTYHSDHEFEEVEVFNWFIFSVLSQLDSKINFKNQSYNCSQYDRKFSSDSDKLFEILIEDIKGNVSILNHSIKFYYDLLIVNKRVNLDNLKSIINVDIF